MLTRKSLQFLAEYLGHLPNIRKIIPFRNEFEYNANTEVDGTLNSNYNFIWSLKNIVCTSCHLTLFFFFLEIPSRVVSVLPRPFVHYLFLILSV